MWRTNLLVNKTIKTDFKIEKYMSCDFCVQLLSKKVSLILELVGIWCFVYVVKWIMWKMNTISFLCVQHKGNIESNNYPDIFISGLMLTKYIHFYRLLMLLFCYLRESRKTRSFILNGVICNQLFVLCIVLLSYLP